MESSGQADSKTVPGFAFRATFEGVIEGFTLLKVLLATTALNKSMLYLHKKNFFVFDFKTVPGFEFRATFEGDIEGFRPVKVLVAATVC